MPDFDPDAYFEGHYPLPSMPNQLRLALEVMGPDIGELIRDDYIDPDRWIGHRRMSALLNLADLLDDYYDYAFDPLPLLACTLADYIKCAVLRLYRGADCIPFDPSFPITFTPTELANFRERFRHRPMSDDEYLHFVNKHLLMPLRKLRRRDRPTRYRKSPFASKKSYWPTLRPRCDAGDYPMSWPLPAGTRLFEPRIRKPDPSPSV
jgi:hypothetical protein